MKAKPTYDELLKKVDYYENKIKLDKISKSVKDSENTSLYYKKLFDFLNAPIIVWDSNKKIQLFDKAFELLTGYASEQILGKNIDFLFPDESIFELQKKIDISTLKDSWEATLPIKCKNKTIKTLHWNLANIYDENNIYLSTIAQGYDITGIHTAQLELQLENKKLDMVLSTLEDPVYFCSENFDVLYMNSKMIQEIGKDGTGKKCYKAIYNLNEPCTWCYFKELKKEGKTRIEVERNNKHFIISSTLLENNSKLTVYHDFTKIKIAEKKLLKKHRELLKAKEKIEESEINYKLLYTKAPLSYQSLNEKGEIIDLNPMWLNTLGYKKEEVLNKWFGDFLPLNQRDAFEKNFENFKNTGSVTNVEFRLKHKKGYYLDVAYEGRTGLHKNGEFKQTYCVFKDVTTSKKNQKLLEQQNEELHLIGSELSEKNRLLLETKNRYINLFDKSPVSLWEEDFSEVKQLLNKKQEQIPDLKLYLDENPDFIYECAAKVKILNVNVVTLELLGVTTKDELIENLGKSFNEKSFETFKEELVSIALNKKEFERETELVQGNGNIVSVILKSIFLDDSTTAIVSMVNITERVKSEEELKKLNTAIGKSTNEVYIFNAENLKFSYTNYGAIQNIGYTLGELKSMTPIDIKPEFMHDKFTNALLPLKNGEIDNLQFETIHQRKDKTIYPIEINLSEFKANNKSHYLAIVIDITERKKNQIEKERNEDLLNNTGQMAHIGGWEIDLKTMKSYFTDEAFRIYGLPKNKIPTTEEGICYYAPEAQPMIRKVFNEALKKGKSYDVEVPFITAKGKNIWVRTAGYPKIIDGKPVYISGIIQDITLQKKVEKELKASKEKAEESDRLKTEFLNNMSHEIRTPMNGILGFSEMLSRPDLATKKRDNFIKIIQSSGQQLLSIIDDILEISRLGTKQVKVVESEVCLNDLLLELFSVFDIKAKENKTPLYLKKQLSDKESTIFTDKSKLNKVISNLLENALKFTSLGFIEFGYLLKKDADPVEIEIYIKDTGIGIEKSKHESIFERFSQVEKDMSKIVGGLGLGLSIAKENSELLGGKIGLISKKGEGATFLVRIPFKPVYKLKDVDSEIDAIQKKHTILIAEDEEVNYLYLETLIKDVIGLDCEIIHVINGQEAVDICKENSAIDLVLMDLKMPGMSGFEATQQIKKFKPNLPIVAQTAYSTIEDKEKAATAGCDDFMAKPIGQKIMNDVLKKYILKNT